MTTETDKSVEQIEAEAKENAENVKRADVTEATRRKVTPRGWDVDTIEKIYEPLGQALEQLLGDLDTTPTRLRPAADVNDAASAVRCHVLDERGDAIAADVAAAQIAPVAATRGIDVTAVEPSTLVLTLSGTPAAASSSEKPTRRRRDS